MCQTATFIKERINRWPADKTNECFDRQIVRGNFVFEFGFRLSFIPELCRVVHTASGSFSKLRRELPGSRCLIAATMGMGSSRHAEHNDAGPVSGSARARHAFGALFRSTQGLSRETLQVGIVSPRALTMRPISERESKKRGARRRPMN